MSQGLFLRSRIQEFKKKSELLRLHYLVPVGKTDATLSKKNDFNWEHSPSLLVMCIILKQINGQAGIMLVLI